jgi:hypothetical protein
MYSVFIQKMPKVVDIMKKVTFLVGLLTVSLQPFMIGTANADELKKFGPDGTLLMDVYPDHMQEMKAEKDKLYKMFEEVEQGKRSKQELDAAVEEWEKKIGIFWQNQKAKVSDSLLLQLTHPQLLPGSLNIPRRLSIIADRRLPNR